MSSFHRIFYFMEQIIDVCHQMYPNTGIVKKVLAKIMYAFHNLNLIMLIKSLILIYSCNHDCALDVEEKY